MRRAKDESVQHELDELRKRVEFLHLRVSEIQMQRAQEATAQPSTCSEALDCIQAFLKANPRWQYEIKTERACIVGRDSRPTGLTCTLTWELL